MKNFDTATEDGAAILDELSAMITDEDGNAILDENLVTENVWGNEELTAGVFVQIDFATTVRYSDMDVDMYHSGNRYTAAAITVGGFDFGSDLSVDRCTISIQNVDLAMSATLINTDELGATVAVSIGGISSTQRIYDLERIFTGELTGYAIAEKTAQLTCSGLMARWMKKTLRTAQATCPWPIGGTECGYAGDEQCSQMYSRCNNLGNHLNFGGFVYLPELMEKKIYWGYPTPV